MDAVKLYYQCVDKIPLWDFCDDAKLGALQCGFTAQPFEVVDNIPGSPYNIIVGSVEESVKWLTANGYQVPNEIPLSLKHMQERYTATKEGLLENWDEMLDLFTKDQPIFIKPQGKIKAFTGEATRKKLLAEAIMTGYDGDIWISEYRNIVSEWRLYIYKDKILKLCNYKGDSLVFPDVAIVKHAFNEAVQQMKILNLNYKAFTIDFGIDSNDDTFVIECNDAWAISNYGLEPVDYFQMIKSRWFQLTGLL